MVKKNAKYLKKFRRTLRKNQTIFEQTLWKHLRNRNLSGHKFVRQYSYGNYILDFYCPNKNLVIEIDGGGHYLNKQVIYDQNRTKFLASNGLRVIRFFNYEITSDLDEVLKKILYELTHPAPSGHPSLSKREGKNLNFVPASLIN